MDLLLQVITNGLTVGGTYALGAIGVSLVFGVLNIINFGQGASYTVAAYIAMVLMVSAGAPVVLAFAGGIVAAFVVGWIVERIAVRPLRDQPLLMSLITTMGLGLIIENLAHFIFGPQTQPLSPTLTADVFQLGTITVSTWEVVTLAVVVGAIACLHYVLHHTDFGTAVRAVAEDRRAAQLLGIDVDRLIVVSFCIASAMGGAAGVLGAALYNSIYPTMGSLSMTKAFAASVLGGMEQIAGAIVGGLLLGIAESVTSVYLSSAWRDAIAFGLLVAVLVVKPTGLLGRRGLDKVERTNLSIFPLPPVPKLDLRQPFLVLPIVVAAALPLVITDAYYLRVLTIMAMSGTIALSLNLIAGFAGLVSLGHAAFYGFGAYATAILSTRYGVPTWISMGLAIAATGLFGAVFAWPMMRLRGHYVAMGTFGLSGVVWMVMLNWIDLTRGPMGIRAIPAPSFFGSELRGVGFYYLILAILVISTFVVLALLNSPFGRALRAMRDDELGMASVGVDPRVVKAKVFIVSAAIAGAAGAFWAHYISFISPDSFTPVVSISYLAMVVLGGLGSVPGAIFGGAVLAALPELLRFASEYRLAIYGLIMVLIILFRPQGLLGRRHDAPTRKAPVARGAVVKEVG
ncbi:MULTISPECIES: ABC transporter permease [unclassified Chelatococcus]|uniref:ABC transporter permease n=1 Tax=unclassified Chelatococcus TaxID=2638111 RepID=UPI001BCE19FC|nr:MULTISPECIES: ABC transporter permease [unclassified Chelatococcus]CAH1649597.1 Branched-chain amino acid transport system permease protein [Hyphomicrobiales bacterium]MBS7741742.1 ABC transporter permease [Chelatococcus sp. HY11]MBX3541460.1 ABC transporter permease [Chelatococcus sp.]MCO5074646.1 ABC transporter permease [Chelatococcus sp.]CAH1692063.1 Branched-chain amino acid transport system permease protein [Hyphomicrobiales bacterium]